MVGPGEGRDNDGLLEGGQGCCFNFSEPLLGLEGSELSFPVTDEEHLQELRARLARGGAPSTPGLQGLGAAEMVGSDTGVGRQGQGWKPHRIQGSPASRSIRKEATLPTCGSNQPPRIFCSLLHSRDPVPIPSAS